MPEQASELAASQDGVITRCQALGSGITDSAIKARVRSGRWRPISQGVYATFTGEPHRRSLWWAAVLGAGSGATLSYQSAAELDRMTGTFSVPIHVTVPRRRRVDRIPGLVVHYSMRIDEARHPCLQPPRTRIEETVLDLTQAAGTFDEAFGWLCRAVGGRFTTPQRLRAAMDARSRVRRRVGLDIALNDVSEGAHSLLELLYLKIERSHGLPHASRQARLSRGGRNQYRDSLYEGYGVAVELDGRVAHPIEVRWRDMRRDNAGAAEGILTLRYGYADVTERPCAVAAEVGRVLQSRRWHGKPRPCGPECMMGKDPGR